jgi:hypothetical protein
MQSSETQEVRAASRVAALAALLNPRRRRCPAGSAPSRNARKKVAAVAGRRQDDDPRINPGDYFISDRQLYRVEHIARQRVLIEDCRSGELLDIDRNACVALERLKRSADSGSVNSE